jgi:hypothetical protein
MDVSIYRGWKAHDNFRPGQRNEPEPVKTAPVHLRKAKPLESLLPRTANWIAALPQDAQPHHLAKQFARIANELCATWDHPAECRRYLDDLMVDKRGTRKGFPAEVIGDLLRLRRLYVEQYPTTDAGWQIPKR